MDIIGVQLAVLVLIAISATVSSLIAIVLIHRADKSHRAVCAAAFTQPDLIKIRVRMPEYVARANEGVCLITVSRAPPDLITRQTDPDRT